MSERKHEGLVSSKMFHSWHISEPSLIFGDGKTHIDPKTGLAVYGPFITSDQSTSAPLSIKVGIVGTGETVGWAKQFLRGLESGVNKPAKNPFQDPPFPGFQKAFNCKLVVQDATVITIPQREVDEISKHMVFEDRVCYAVGLFTDRIESLSDVTPRPDVVLCALPHEVVNYCMAKRTKSGQWIAKTKRTEAEFVKKLRRQRELGQTFLDDFEAEVDRILEQRIETSNFRRGLKSKSMKYNMPTQIVLPKTITPDYEQKAKHLQNDNTIAWNISVGLYYKGSGFPWTMTRLKRGTCYVGISFYKTQETGIMRTSMAQIFTYTGEGLILRGDKFKWEEKGRSPHLNEEQAKSLMDKVISLYESRMNETPSRVVVHKSSRYLDDEKRGFERALDNIKYHDLIAFGRRKIRFFRCGQYPPLRGTVIKISNRRFILYTRGYTSYLRTYPGGHVPLPLDIIEMHGDSDPDTILTEILALSKMNWNSAEFSLAQPITLLFSKRVGEVMAYVNDIDLRHEYRYYM